MEIHLSIQLAVIQLTPVIYSYLVFDYYIETSVYSRLLLYLVLTLLYKYSSFMNYYLSIPLLIVILFCVCDSMIDLFTVYVEFC